MRNPNEYDDDAYVQAQLDIVSAIDALWSAGGSVDEIVNEISNALENAGIGHYFHITGVTG